MFFLEILKKNVIVNTAMNSQTDIIKDKLNILDVVGQYVKLEKAGKTYKGKSPFNNEKTASFFVSPEKGFFYCFSSGKGGDIFTFIQEIERIEFPDALKLLAEKAGVDLQSSSENTKDQSERARLFELLDLATKWYEVQLRKNKEVVDYLLNRGLTKETIIKFRIGFAQDSWRDIYDYLKSKKYNDIEIERAGLSIPKDGSGYYDRFRSRIMFPMTDARGRVVGFSGRIFNGDEKTAKYINSPEGPLFDKSKVLYGYHTAKSAISKMDYCILVEGQLDVLLSQQAGYENTVAISGTGLTDEHIEMVKRFTDTLYLALDSDNAGIKATRRSVISAYKHDMRVKIILLRENEDPADTIKRSTEAWDIALMEPRDYIDYRIALSEKKNPDFESKQTLIHKDLFEFVSFTQSATTREHLLQKIALFLGVPLDAIRNDFESYSPVETLEKKEEKIVSQKIEKKDYKKEIILTLLYIQESFSEEFSSDEETIQKKYKEIFESEFEDDILEMSNEERSMFIFITQEKKPDKNYLYFLETIFSLLKSVRLDQLTEQAKKIGEKIRKEQILNPSQIPVELMRKSNDIKLEINTLMNQ